MDLLLILLSIAGLLGCARFAQWASRDDRRRRRLNAIRQRNLKRDTDVWEQSRMRDRGQPEAVDQMVIRHLRGGANVRSHG